MAGQHVPRMAYGVRVFEPPLCPWDRRAEKAALVNSDSHELRVSLLLRVHLRGLRIDVRWSVLCMPVRSISVGAVPSGEDSGRRRCLWDVDTTLATRGVPRLGRVGEGHQADVCGAECGWGPAAPARAATVLRREQHCLLVQPPRHF